MKELNWKTVEGTQETKPQELEITKTRIYIRKNILAITKETNEKIINMWKYEEAVTDKDAALQYLSKTNEKLSKNVDINASNIDYLAMEAGVEL